MGRRPGFWLIVALTTILMMLVAAVSFVINTVINERGLVGLGVLALIALIFVVGVSVAQRTGEPRRARKRSLPMPQYVANEAMRRAKFSAGKGRPALRDIGILAYRDDGDPDVYRRQAVRGSARQLRPYVVLHWGGLLADEPEVLFVIEDGAGCTCFEVKQTVRLVRGRNFVTTETWLPIHEDGGAARVERDGRWKLTVSVDGVMTAAHPFQVKLPVRSELSGAITADGEIEPEQAPDWSAEPLSLKELLTGNLASVRKSAKH